MKDLSDHIQVYIENNKQPLIFNGSTKQPLVQKIGLFSINAIGTVIWLYLWKFLFTGLAWIFGVELAYEELIVRNGLMGLKSFATDLMPFGLILCVALWLWALFNLVRFHAKQRRHDANTPVISNDSLWTTVDSNDLANARRGKIIFCEHTTKGGLCTVTNADNKFFQRYPWGIKNSALVR